MRRKILLLITTMIITITLANIIINKPVFYHMIHSENERYVINILQQSFMAISCYSVENNWQYPQSGTSKNEVIKTINKIQKGWVKEEKGMKFYNIFKNSPSHERMFYLTPKQNSNGEIVDSKGFKILDEVFELLCYKSDKFFYVAYADGTIKKTTFKKIKKRHKNKELIKLVIGSSKDWQ